jgi:transposase-like protein
MSKPATISKKILPLKIRQVRIFSETFKRSKVDDLMHKRVTVSELSRLYNISPTSVYNWLYLYSPNHKPSQAIIVETDSDVYTAKVLLGKLASTERIVGQKQMQIDYLEQLIAIASEHFDIDLKKTFSEKLSNGSVTTDSTTAGISTTSTISAAQANKHIISQSSDGTHTKNGRLK